MNRRTLLKAAPAVVLGAFAVPAFAQTGTKSPAESLERTPTPTVTATPTVDVGGVQVTPTVVPTVVPTILPTETPEATETPLPWVDTIDVWPTGTPEVGK